MFPDNDNNQSITQQNCAVKIYSGRENFPEYGFLSESESSED